MNTSSVDPSMAPFGAPPRQLSDDVLQTAEEAVLSLPAEDGQPQLEALSRPADAAASSYQDGVARYVAKRPFQAALMAMAVGALAALALRSALPRRRD